MFQPKTLRDNMEGKTAMVKKALKRGIQIALIPILCGIVGLVLLIAAFLLPTGRISEHVQSSVSMLVQETNYFSITPTVAGTTLDNNTEAIYLNEALINTKDTSLMECILSGYQYNVKNFSGSNIETLTKAMAEPENTMLFDGCKRFFNGYEVPVKLLLILTNYSGIRQFNMFLSLFLTLLLIYLMNKRKLQHYIIAVIVSLLFIRPLTVTLNMTFFGFYLCMLIPCICMLVLKKETLKQKAWLLFGITGAVTYYFNMNYIQLLSFAIPLMFYYLIVGLPSKPLCLIKLSGYFFIVWLVGCIGMMVFKWVVYAVFIDSNIFEEMLDAFLFRTNIDKGSRLYAIKVNWETAIGNKWWNVLEIVFALGSIVLWFRKKGKPGLSWTDILFLALMLALPLGRYIILANHVTIHAFVTYRLLLIPVMAFNLLVTKLWSKNGDTDVERICP